MKIYQFPKGGLELEDLTVPPVQASRIAYLPTLALIPLIQHPGAEAVPLVEAGSQVREGMLIGRGYGLGSANIHASIPGTVVKIVSWKLADGRSTKGFLIRLEGSFDKLGKKKENFIWQGLSGFDLQRILSEKGIVEMEEPGRPFIEIIRDAANQSKTVSLVVRMIFDDPWLVADYVLSLERLDEILIGASIAAKAASATHIVFAVSNQEMELAERIRIRSVELGIQIKLIVTGSRYPQRNRRELETVLKSYQKNENIDLGSWCICGPATLAAVFDAVVQNKPILERYVAVGGGSIKHPQVLRVRIGTRIGDVISQCGGFLVQPKKIATGSPLKGMAVQDLDEPVTKTTIAVVALTEDQIGGEIIHDCTNCGECRSVCPVGLDPEYLFKLALLERDAEALAHRANSCHGCGCCEVVCPSRLPLSSTIRVSIKRGKK
ncbi:SLBB domain-containing protein [Gracilinema caldarium]|uniref:SLBB domain-containing protein n=1 Tax=Gracilinema caldarium TaxID=215591 RepID=UPI0026EAF023|nr:SLBB domain-containing protein [Gracilinema caldarium]